MSFWHWTQFHLFLKVKSLWILINKGNTVIFNNAKILYFYLIFGYLKSYLKYFFNDFSHFFGKAIFLTSHVYFKSNSSFIISKIFIRSSFVKISFWHLNLLRAHFQKLYPKCLSIYILLNIFNSFLYLGIKWKCTCGFSLSLYKKSLRPDPEINKFLGLGNYFSCIDSAIFSCHYLLPLIIQIFCCNTSEILFTPPT